MFVIMDSVKQVQLGNAKVTLRSLKFANEISGIYDIKDEKEDLVGKLSIRITKSEIASLIEMKKSMNDDSLDQSFSRFQIQYM